MSKQRRQGCLATAIPAIDKIEAREIWKVTWPVKVTKHAVIADVAYAANVHWWPRLMRLTRSESCCTNPAFSTAGGWLAHGEPSHATRNPSSVRRYFPCAHRRTSFRAPLL